MSENTANAGHDKGPVICFGIAETDEKGNINMPPEYAYQIQFTDENCIVIPLEGKKKQEKTNKSNKEIDEMLH